MMQYRHGVIIALLVLLSMPIGYVLAPAPKEELANKSMPWVLPTLDGKSSDLQLKPSVLARFWPVKKRVAAEGKSKSSITSAHQVAHNEWVLVAIIRQGHNPSALVLSPDQKFIRLSVGMALDDARRVIGIEPDKLYWENSAGDQGHLTLYPRPAAVK
ncbi:hypothetical protein JGK46_004081 [Aeromonas bestiarum]|nr:hypothetical protein [Aeromonas bestiarum]